MSSISFVTQTGNSQTDKIFVGIFGVNDPVKGFEVASDLKGIHLFTLLTPKALARMGVDISKSLVTIEIGDETIPALKATMLLALKDRWLSTYDARLQGENPDVGTALVVEEREQVEAAVVAAIEALNVPRADVQVQAEFKNVAPECYDEDYLAPPNELYATEVLRSRLGDMTVRSEKLDLSTLTTSSIKLGNAACEADGTVVTEMTLFGQPHQFPEVLAALGQLPAQLVEATSLCKNAHFVGQINWHAPTPVDTAAVDAAGAQGDEAEVAEPLAPTA